MGEGRDTLVEDSRAMRAMASRRRYWYGHVCRFCCDGDGGVESCGGAVGDERWYVAEDTGGSRLIDCL